MPFLSYWRLKPVDLDQLTNAKVRELVDATDTLIEKDRQAAAEAKRSTPHG